MTENNIFTLTFDCEFMRDGNACYELMSVQVPKIYDHEDQSKGTAIAIESAIDSIKAQKGYDALIRMSLKTWENDKPI
jgi:hypothetical protein